MSCIGKGSFDDRLAAEGRVPGERLREVAPNQRA